jgi:predicted nucleic acid-binding protein
VRPELFVDTSAWYPIALTSHPDHARLASALTARVRAGARVVTTNIVLAETHALLTVRVHRAAALAFLKAARTQPNEVVSSTDDLEGRAITEWIERFADQPFSLADAVSFVVMSDRGIRDVLTLDQHFATAGFSIVGGAAPSRPSGTARTRGRR